MIDSLPLSSPTYSMRVQCEIEPTSPALQGRCLTIGPSGNYHITYFFIGIAIVKISICLMLFQKFLKIPSSKKKKILFFFLFGLYDFHHSVFQITDLFLSANL